MYEKEQINTKRSEFRNQIRRRQIQSMFSEQRIKFAEDLLKEQMEQIMKELDSKEKQEQWLAKRADQLGAAPHKGWHQTLRKLSIGTRAFMKEGFGDWIKVGLIGSLAQGLKQQFLQLEVSRMSACILQDIFFYLPADSPQISLILEYNFILDIVQLCANDSETAQNYYELIACMVQDRHYMRNLFIDSGLVQVLTDRLKGYANGDRGADVDGDQAYCALTVAYKLVKIYEIPGGSAFPKGNTIIVFIPIFDNYLTLVKREDSIRTILKAFATLAQTQKEHILSYLFNSPNLIPYVLHSLCLQGDPAIRFISASLLVSILSSQKYMYAEQLLARGILDQVLACARMKNNQQNCIFSLINIISNLVGNTLEEVRAVVEHEVFSEFILSQANQTENIKFHENAIFVLSTMIQFENYPLTDRLLRKFNILEPLILGLTVPVPSVTNSLQILRALRALVHMYNGIYTENGNKVVMDLERIYNINNVLTCLEERLHNKRVLAMIQGLIDDMNGN